jgi:hypothetical protein
MTHSAFALLQEAEAGASTNSQPDRGGPQRSPLELQPAPASTSHATIGTQVTCCTISPSKAQLATGSEDGRVAIWDITGPTPLQLLERREFARPGSDPAPVVSVAWSQRASEVHLVSCSRDSISWLHKCVVVQRDHQGIRIPCSLENLRSMQQHPASAATPSSFQPVGVVDGHDSLQICERSARLLGCTLPDEQNAVAVFSTSGTRLKPTDQQRSALGPGGGCSASQPAFLPHAQLLSSPSHPDSLPGSGLPIRCCAIDGCTAAVVWENGAVAVVEASSDANTAPACGEPYMVGLQQRWCAADQPQRGSTVASIAVCAEIGWVNPAPCQVLLCSLGSGLS